VSGLDLGGRLIIVGALGAAAEYFGSVHPRFGLCCRVVGKKSDSTSISAVYVAYPDIHVVFGLQLKFRHFNFLDVDKSGYDLRPTLAVAHELALPFDLP